MKVYHLDPTTDPRWVSLLKRHGKASVFHTPDWLRATRCTYTYEPIAFTTSQPTSELENGIVVCDVKSWLTGRRLVSVPFSDHCEPLCDSVEDLNLLICHLQNVLALGNWEYIEVRPIDVNSGRTCAENGFASRQSYFLHILNLRPNLDQIFRILDRDSVQRRIQRADRSGLVERCGIYNELLKDFYSIFVITRRRHGLPPSPYAWFANLIQCLGNALEIRVAYKQDPPVAAILLLRFRDVVYYKYGCSDVRFKNLGAMPWLLWRAISSAKLNGVREFDLGRAEVNDTGLVTFKNHWVPNPQPLVYWRLQENSPVFDHKD